MYTLEPAVLYGDHMDVGDDQTGMRDHMDAGDVKGKRFIYSISISIYLAGLKPAIHTFEV